MNKLKAQNIKLKEKLKELENKTILLKFFAWIIDDMKIKKIRKEIHEQQK